MFVRMCAVEHELVWFLCERQHSCKETGSQKQGGVDADDVIIFVKQNETHSHGRVTRQQQDLDFVPDLRICSNKLKKKKKKDSAEGLSLLPSRIRSQPEMVLQLVCNESLSVTVRTVCVCVS